MKIGCRDDIRFFYGFILRSRLIILLLQNETACRLVVVNSVSNLMKS